MLSQLVQGALVVITPPTVFWLLLGTAIGLIIGYLPAIGAITGVVLFLPFTYGLDLAPALVFLCAIHATGQYGDSMTSILLNTPGGPSTVASCWEGYPMTRRGEGARALGISTFGSMIGGLAGSIGLIVIAQPLTELALMIGPPEYFALGIMALSLVSIASEGNTLKGLIMASFGLMLSFIGEDPVSGYVDRFSFGSIQLASGIPTLGVFVGMFAISQIITMLEEGGTTVKQGEKLSLPVRAAFNAFFDVIRNPFTLIRSIAIGLYVGILPILGPGTASVLAYLTEKKYSPQKKEFGQGVPSALVATEVTKGCCTIGDLIPTFTLGIPGSITGAILLGAFVLHGVQPGPQFLQSGSAPIVFAGIALTQILMALVGLPLIRYCSQIVKIPNTILAPILTVLCFIGALVERNAAFDIVFLIMFGILGYMLNRFSYSSISLIIGLIISNMVETNFHRTISMGDGSPYLLWTRPLSVLFFIITFLFLAWPFLKKLYSHLAKRYPGEGKIDSVPSEEMCSRLEEITVAEVAFLCSLVVLAIIFLFEARTYPANVKLFPLIVSFTMLLLIGCLITSKVRRRAKVVSIKWRKPKLSKGSMSFIWSLATFMGYYVLIYIVGFLSATGIYLIAVPSLLRYHSRVTILLFVGISVLCIGVFVRLLNIIFPTPILPLG
jgi:putative tricarboxylic transport membrane protein